MPVGIVLIEVFDALTDTMHLIPLTKAVSVVQLIDTHDAYIIWMFYRTNPSNERIPPSMSSNLDTYYERWNSGASHQQQIANTLQDGLNQFDIFDDADVVFKLLIGKEIFHDK